MLFNRYTICSVSIFLVSNAHAENFADTFNGDTKINVSLYVFAADVDGTISKGNTKYNVDQPFHDTLKKLDSSFMGYAELSKGKWGIYTDKQIVKTAQDINAIYLPVAVSTKLNQSSYGIYYQAYVSPETTDQHLPRMVIEPTVGMYHTKVKATLSAFNHSVGADTSWSELFAGVRFRYNFNSPWNVASELAFGEKNTISAQAYLGYRFQVLGQNVNLRVGYRYFEQDHKSNDLRWNMRQHGPVVGINLPIL